jgi:hypothetical protein
LPLVACRDRDPAKIRAEPHAAAKVLYCSSEGR